MEEKSIKILRRIRYIIITALLLFVAVFVIVNRNEINIDNIKRIMAQFDFAFSTSSSASDRIEFNAQESNKYSLYKNSFVSLTEEGLKIFDKSNNLLFNYKKSFSSPVLLTSRKYCLGYDYGKDSFFLTNSFTNVFDKTINGTITCAALNDEGWFAVAGKESGYKSVMRVYTKDLEEQLSVSLSEKYIIGCAISENSKAVAYITLSTKTGHPVYEVNYLLLDSKEPKFTSSIDDSLIGINFVNGNINVIGKNNYYNINIGDGSVEGQYSYEGRALKSFVRNNNYTVLQFESFKENMKYDIDFVGGNAKKISGINIDKEIYDISACGDKCAVLLKDSAELFSVSNGALYKAFPLDQSYKEILNNEQNDIYLISSDFTVKKNMDEIGG